MTEQTDAAEVETLAVELREREIARQLARDPDAIASSDTPRTIAAQVLASDWLAARESAAEARGAERALRDRLPVPHPVRQGRGVG